MDQQWNVPAGTPPTPPPVPPPPPGGPAPFPPAGGQDPNRKVPPPPPPEINIRTMASDINSLRESGGIAARPETLQINPQGQAAAPGPSMPKATPPPPPLPEEELKIPGYTGPEETIFTPQQAPAQKEEAAPAPKSSKKLIFIILGLVLVLGLGATGYFFYPTIADLVGFGAPAATPTPTPEPTPEPTATPEPTPTPAPLPAHKSEFLTTPAFVIEKNVEAVRQDTFIAAINDVAKQVTSGSLAEVVLTDAEQKPVTFQQLFAALYPAFTAEELALFGTDQTLFIYVKDGVAFPGFFARVKNVADADKARTLLNSKFEAPAFPYLKSLFIANPGEAAAAFKDGKIGDISTRYLTFSQAGTAFNYGIGADGLVVVGTSYTGLTEAAKLLKSQ